MPQPRGKKSHRKLYHSNRHLPLLIDALGCRIGIRSENGVTTVEITSDGSRYGEGYQLEVRSAGSLGRPMDAYTIHSLGAQSAEIRSCTAKDRTQV